MSLFNIDLNKFTREIITPPVQRTLVPFLDLLVSFLHPLVSIFADLDSHTDTQKKRARYSGQILVMRAAIEDFTGISGIRIVVNRDLNGSFFGLISETNQPQEFNYISLESEGQPQHMGLQSEGPVLGLFRIEVPVASFNQQVENQIRAEVDIFGIPIQNYSIVSY